MKSMTLTPDLVRERVLTHMCRRSGQFLMFYRPDEKNLVPYCMPNMLQGLPESLSFPDGLIKELKLDDNSIHSLRRVTHVIDSQSPEEQTCLIRIRYDRQPIWVQMRFFRNQTDDGRVYYIIVGENADNLMIAKERLRVERQTMVSVEDTALAVASFTVTHDAHLHKEGIRTTGETEDEAKDEDVLDETYNEAARLIDNFDEQSEATAKVLLKAAREIPDKNQRQVFIRRLSNRGFLEAYEKGDTNYDLEYQRYYQGQLIWMKTTVHLLIDPDTDELLVFIYTYDIDEQKVNNKITDLLVKRGSDFIVRINTQNDDIRYHYISDFQKEFFPYRRLTHLSYTQGFVKPILRLVQGDAADAFARQLSKDNVLKSLKESGRFVITYDFLTRNMPMRRKQLQFYNFDETKLEVLVIQTDITEAYQKELLDAQNRKAAITDPLTGLINRAGIRSQLDELEASYQDKNQPFTLAMADIDFFKNVNDTYTHDCGDEILRDLADLMNGFMKERGLGQVGRMGGEEFLIIFTHSHLDEAHQALEEMRALIEQSEFQWEDKTLKVTMTFGAREYTPQLGITKTIHEADQNLYKGKNTGRNTVVV